MPNVGWGETSDIEKLLESIRINSINLSLYHRERYWHFKSFGKYFRIPIIVLSSITSASSVGLQPVMEQGLISGITCLLAFVIAVLSSTEMYLKIQDSMEKELNMSKEYYTLGIDIYKCLSTGREHRTEEPRIYLDKKYSEYKALTESSSILKKDLRVDCLADIPEEFRNKPLKVPPQFMPMSFPDLKDIHSQTKPEPLELKQIELKPVEQVTILAIPSPRQRKEPLEFSRPPPLSSKNEPVKKVVSFNPVHEPEESKDPIEIV
tara:strand:+ start:1298 stop:2089 length:792 start_codon:yes stop_codon:yes gene_type:complete